MHQAQTSPSVFRGCREASGERAATSCLLWHAVGYRDVHRDYLSRKTRFGATITTSEHHGLSYFSNQCKTVSLSIAAGAKQYWRGLSPKGVGEGRMHRGFERAIEIDGHPVALQIDAG